MCCLRRPQLLPLTHNASSLPALQPALAAKIVGGAGFLVTAFDLAAGTVTFTGGDQGGVVDNSLTLWEQDGYLCHNATVGNYADAMDVDPGPGYARMVVATADRISVDCGDGHDVVDASGVTDKGVFIYGGAGPDELTGSNTISPWGDYIDGGSGDDTLVGLGGDDVIIGGLGADRIQELRPPPGNDVLSGGDDPDTIIAGTGLDEVDGGGGQR